jgi:RNA polymerase sigma factor (sigma-70 family)
MPETSLDQLLAQRKKFMAFLQRRVPDAALAEDILQTAYLRAYEHKDVVEPGEPAIAWFYRLLRNSVIDNFRRQETRNKALENWALELERTTQPTPEMEDEVCACLTGTIDRLKPDYAEVLRAVDLGNLRLQEFASKHELSASNAGVRIHRARAALRRELVRTCGACSEHGCLNCTCKRNSRLGA